MALLALLASLISRANSNGSMGWPVEPCLMGHQEELHGLAREMEFSWANSKGSIG